MENTRKIRITFIVETTDKTSSLQDIENAVAEVWDSADDHRQFVDSYGFESEEV